MRLPAPLAEHAVRWLTRREHPAGREITLHRRRIYILPTRAGYAYALMLVIMLVGAINYSNSMAFLLTFLLAGLGASAIWHTHRNLLGLRVSRLPLEPVFTGETACCRYRIENPSHVARRGLLLQRGTAMAPPMAVTARDEGIAQILLPARRRGRLRPGRLTLSTAYPLGLFRAWTWIEFDEALTVYPKPLPVDRATAGDEGEAEAKPPDRREGDEFAGLRDYRPGDPPRRVDWKALARTGELYTRDFETPGGGQIWIDWDALPDTDTETRLSLLCHQVLLAHERGLRFGLRLPGLACQPDQGPDHCTRCLTALALFGESGAGP